MRIRAMMRLVAWIAAAGGAMVTPAAADFVDNFNAENGGSTQLNYSTLANFDVTTGTVDLIGTGFFDFYPGNGLYLDLNGSSGVSGTLTTKSLFGPGQYLLSFALGNNSTSGGSNSVTVSLGAYQETFTRSGQVALQTITRTINLTSTSRLVFATPASDNDRSGIILDNVAINAATVPEPSSLVLCGVGLAGLAVASRRKTAARQ